MLKFDKELADNFKKIYSLGEEIISVLSESAKSSDFGEKVLELYKARKQYFDNISDILKNNQGVTDTIQANIDKWQQKLEPLIKQDQVLQALLADRLESTKNKLKLSTQGKGLLVYSKGK